MNSSIVVAFVCLFNTYSVPGYAVMRIGRLAGIIGLNLCFSPTPRVGRASNSIVVPWGSMPHTALYGTKTTV